MAKPLEGKKIANLSDRRRGAIRIDRPRKALEEAAANTVLISPTVGTIQAMNHKEKGNTLKVDLALSVTNLDDYDGLLLPGGVANPDELRTNAKAVSFVKRFFDSGKPVAAICHGPWMLVEADVVRGRTLTSWPSLKTDIRKDRHSQCRRHLGGPRRRSGRTVDYQPQAR